MEQSLRTWLATCPGIAIVASYGDGLTALTQLAALQAGLLVIDSNLLDQEVEHLVSAVKSTRRATRCLVLIRSSQREAKMLALGADAVALHDDQPQHLQALVAQLMQEVRDLQTAAKHERT